MGLFPLAARRAGLPWDDIKSTDGVTCWQHKNKRKNNAVLSWLQHQSFNGPSMQDSHSSTLDRNPSTMTGRYRSGYGGRKRALLGNDGSVRIISHQYGE